MQGNSVPSMSVIPWSKALLVVMEASGQVLRGPEAPTRAPPNLARPGLVRRSRPRGRRSPGGAAAQQRGGWGGGGRCITFSCVWLEPCFSDKPHTNFPCGWSDHQGLAGVGSGQASGSGHWWGGAVLGGGDMETWKMAGIQLEPLVSPLTRAVGIAHLNCSMSCFFPLKHLES